MSLSGRARGRRSMPKAWRYVVAERDGRNCAICGKDIGDIDKATLDHVVPRAHGGKDIIGNLQLTHFRCNIERGTAVSREDRIAQRDGRGW